MKTANEVSKAQEPPALCSLKVVLACERARDETFNNILKNRLLSHPFGPMEFPESTHYIMGLLNQKLADAQAGYREFQKLIYERERQNPRPSGPGA